MAVSYSAGKPNKWEEVEGKHTSILYESPKGRNPLEAMANDRQALKEADFDILYNCSG